MKGFTVNKCPSYPGSKKCRHKLSCAAMLFTRSNAWRAKIATKEQPLAWLHLCRSPHAAANLLHAGDPRHSKGMQSSACQLIIRCCGNGLLTTNRLQEALLSSDFHSAPLVSSRTDATPFHGRLVAGLQRPDKTPAVAAAASQLRRQLVCGERFAWRLCAAANCADALLLQNVSLLLPF